MIPLCIIYQDEYLVAINKPHGLLVHRSKIAMDVEVFALQLLRDQLGRAVYPVHRIDRKTSGILLFAFSKEVEKLMQAQFYNNEVDKRYLALLRGFTDEDGKIDYALKKENGTPQNALTFYKTLAKTEIDLPFGGHNTSRYSLVEANPQTGRMHQLRKHFSHIFHPIIGDRTHGCNKQNKLFKEHWGLDTMFLHASHLRFIHPVTKLDIYISAPLQQEYLKVLDILLLSHVDLSTI